MTTISRSMAARLEAKGVPPARLQVLPNWADLDKVRPGPRLNALRRELGLTSETVVLYAGNLGEKQGLEVILEAAALTRGKPSIRYLVAGEGAARDRIKLRAQDLGLDNLTFLPLQSNSRLPLLLAAADLHLVVQRQKAADLVMPSKLTNIMAAGRPFIATAGEATELARVTTESRAGLVVPPEDGRALAQAVLEIGRGPRRQEGDGRPGPPIRRGFLGPGTHLAAVGRVARGPRLTFAPGRVSNPLVKGQASAGISGQREKRVQ